MLERAAAFRLGNGRFSAVFLTGFLLWGNFGRMLAGASVQDGMVAVVRTAEQPATTSGTASSSPSAWAAPSASALAPITATPSTAPPPSAPMAAAPSASIAATPSALPSAIDTTALLEALERLRKELLVRPESREAGLKRLEVAFRLGRPSLMLDAWERYATIPGYDGFNARQAASTLALEQLLRKGMHRTETRVGLMYFLARARMFRLVSTLALQYPDAAGDTSLRDVLAYTRYLDDFEACVCRYFARKAAGHPDKRDFIREIHRMDRALWAATGHSSDRFNTPSLRDWMRERFGALVTFNSRHDFYTIAHSVHSFPISAEVDGKTLTCTYHILDSEYGNAFMGWKSHVFLFGAFSTQGRQIYQYRVHMGEEATKLWTLVSDSVRMDRWRTGVEANLGKACRTKDPTSIRMAAAVGEGLKLRACRRILDSLRVGHPGDDSLRFRFLELLNRHEYASTILGHEFRHQVDGARRRSFVMNRSAMERNAGLDAVVQAGFPELAAAAFLKDSMKRRKGFMANYTRSNQAILKHLVRWMSDHSSSIVGFDRSAVILPQMLRMSTGQVMDAFRAQLR